MNTKDLMKKRIIIATHVYTTGPSQDLKKFLTDKKIESLVFIGHPLFYNEILKGSGFEIYKKGIKEKELYQKLRKTPFIIRTLKDAFLNIFWTIKYGRGSDIYIGFDNLNAFSGVVLKFCHLVQKCVYYVVDYNPKRYKNKILNYVYHKIDQFCVTYCDETWNLSPRMEEARKEYFNFSKGNQKVVPVGVWVDRIKVLDFDEIEKHSVVFVGHVTKKQGIQHVINAMPEIIKEITDFKFKIVGGGEYLDILKSRVKELKIEKYVDFFGYIEDSEEVENILKKCMVGVALYEKYDEEGNLSFTYFADPGKIKLYLACGLPVLLSDVSCNAQELENLQCGKIVTANKDSVVKSIVDFITKDNFLMSYRENALKYRSSFDWEKIFERAICIE